MFCSFIPEKVELVEKTYNDNGTSKTVNVRSVLEETFIVASQQEIRHLFSKLETDLDSL